MSNPETATEMNCANKALTGTIPPGLGYLTGLTSVFLDNNELTGTIPADLGKLTNLKELKLHFNAVRNWPNLIGGLRGTIPPELGDLTGLTQLWLSANDLTGTIPADLGKLTKLGLLQLSNNKLTGTIPADLGKLTKLTGLALTGNQLNGTIPADLGKLTDLTQLYLDYNQLTGAIPPELAGVSEVLELTGNQLNGCVPRCIDICFTGISGEFSTCFINNENTNPDITGLCTCACGEYHGNTCTTCEAGHYCPDGSAKEMTPCPAGKWGNLTGQTNVADACPEGSASQEPCPAGHYCQTAAVKTPCPAGKYNENTHSTELTDCTTCPDGMYGYADVVGGVSQAEACVSVCTGTGSDGCMVVDSNPPAPWTIEARLQTIQATLNTTLQDIHTKLDAVVPTNVTKMKCSVLRNAYNKNGTCCDDDEGCVELTGGAS